MDANAESNSLPVQKLGCAHRVGGGTNLLDNT
jgi:hypothetical protein